MVPSNNKVLADLKAKSIAGAGVIINAILFLLPEKSLMRDL